MNTQDIKNWLDLREVKNYTINSEGLVDVAGHVSLMSHGIERFPFAWGRIKGNFDCSANNLCSLIGAPHTVEGNFWANLNCLVDLQGAPRSIGGNFFYQDNRLQNVDDGPPHARGHYVLLHNHMLGEILNMKTDEIIAYTLKKRLDEILPKNLKKSGVSKL